MSKRKPDLERQLQGDREHLTLAIIFDGPGHYLVESEDGHKFYMNHVAHGPMPPVTEYIHSEYPGTGLEELVNAADMVLRFSNGAPAKHDAPKDHLQGGPLPAGRYFTQKLENYDEYRVRDGQNWPQPQGWPSEPD